MFDITPYLIGLLSLIALFLATYLVPLIKSKLTENQQILICSMVDIAVFAAEKLYGGNNAENKLRYALEQAEDRLKMYGIKMDADSLRPYIEAAVKALDIRQVASDRLDQPVPGLADFLRSDDEGKGI